MPPDPSGRPRRPERRPPDDPIEWLNRAKGNLRRAREVSPGFYLEDLCFDAQQAAEKALKGVLLARDAEFPFTHDLAHLVTLAQADGDPLPDDVRFAARLTRYAVTTRYPGAAEEVTAEEHREAVRIADAVVTWAEQRTADLVGRTE